MPRKKCDINIGKRMREECDRIFPTCVSAAHYLHCDRKCLHEWSIGTTPEVIMLARLHWLGGDVIYVLTGKNGGDYRKKEGTIQ